LQSPVLRHHLREIRFHFPLREVLFHPGFTRHYFALVDIMEFDGCLQLEEMLGPVISFQGLNDLFGGCLDLRMFHLGERERISFSSQDRPNNRHPGVAGDVT
jgi:hypothetical protein